MSKIIRFYEPGPAEVQRIEAFTPERPGDDEIRIRVQAIGLNRSDLIFRSGHHPMKPPSPACNGAEAAGIVDCIGANVQGFREGDAVVVIPHMDPQRGTYAEFINVSAKRVMTAAPTLSAAENAAFWASYLTAYGGLIQVAQLRANDFVVIPAASSSVGLAAIQLARAIGAHPIALTRNADKTERLKAAGAHSVLLSKQENLSDALLTATGGCGARVVFDPVGGDGVNTLAAAMAQQGIYVLYGVMSPNPTLFPVAAAFEKLLTMTIFRLDFVYRPDELIPARAFLDPLLQQGLLRPAIDRVFNFDDVVAAHHYMESNQQLGKIVLEL